MKKRIIIMAALLAAIHLVLAVGSVMIAYRGGMEAFDNPDYKPSGIVRVADKLAGVLVQPAGSLWTPWMSKNMPAVVEWAFVLGNSLLWGLAFAIILNSNLLLKRREERSPRDTSKL